MTVLNAVTTGLDNRNVWICFAECKLQSDCTALASLLYRPRGCETYC